ncbi:GcrA family cell cycle regulator [Phreatobacter sp.]|uniref:GcrA family cell cycle regulator n=1 Tax=Phreatobacter sp. TaxID=1966341 RepID=UPI003F71FC2A
MQQLQWTDERVELLKKLWNDGLSASQIAGELGSVTRNAVIGKVHRLGLSGRAKPTASTAPRARKTTRAAPSAPPRPSMPASRSNLAFKPRPAPMLLPQVEAARPAEIDNVVPMGERCTIMELKEYSCRWPIGDPGKDDFRYCGARSGSGIPYCSYHARIAYQPVVDRRRDKRSALGR